MHSIKLTTAAVLVSLSLAAPAAAQTVVYDQPGTSAACAGACWTSTYGADIGGFRTFDDFTLGSGATITGATWRGFIQPAGANGPVVPDIALWDVIITDDNGSGPGTTLFDATLPAAQVQATLLGVSTFNGPVNVYEFTATFATPFEAQAGVEYWFSPLAEQATFYPFFSWSPAADTSGESQQFLLNDGTRFIRPGDRAFSLISVPEPSTWAIMITGFGAAGAMLRRRRALTPA